MSYRLAHKARIFPCPKSGSCHQVFHQGLQCHRINIFNLSTVARPGLFGGSRISTVVSALLLLGLGTTAVGVYEFYSLFTMWPPEVRGDLRAGLKAKNQGDLGLSERYLQRAWSTAQELPIDVFAFHPYLKTSGIAIALAGVLEANNNPERAYEVYGTVLAQLQDLGKRGKLTGEERMRGVAVACKLGEMANMYQLAEEEEERWLVWAVEELLRVVQDQRGETPVTRDTHGSGSESTLADLELPGWVSRTDLGAPIEALATFYARSGKLEYAMPLYLHAISVLVPPLSQKSSSPEERCRGAQLMNNLSELIIRGAPTPEKIHQAEAWAKQADSVIQKTKQLAKGEPERAKLCEHVLTAVLFNLASLREMADDRTASRELFVASLKQAKTIGMKKGVIEAQAALRRLDRNRSLGIGPPNPPDP